MNGGGSLGYRSGSYGSLSLSQQGQNGGGGHTRRKSWRGSLSNGGQKERFMLCFWRYLGRSQKTKAGMLILLIFGFSALISVFFKLSREDASKSSILDFDGSILNKYRVEFFSRENEANSRSSTFQTVMSCEEDVNPFPNPTPSVAATLAAHLTTSSSHPCENFKVSPPHMVDKRLIGPRACPVCYVPVEQAPAYMPNLPSMSPVLQHLSYFRGGNPVKTESHGGSEFGGFPSLKQRNDSFSIRKSMTVHCGFFEGCRAGDNTFFSIDKDDLKELDEFHEVIVASAVFGIYDIIQQPESISDIARKNVPFYMFIDEETEAYMKQSGTLDNSKRAGLWRIIVVHNLPYNDPRRNGKVPKLLLHRLFPKVRYSIWLDGKLRLIVDPYQVLERFLWRENATFAISRHYSRFDVFTEAEANKAANKYDNFSIDQQIEFYKNEGLTAYTEAKLPITSDVPEGCVIIREHNPITNLFSCLWFNEVDRFTPRDQLSFSIVRDKIMKQVDWKINMFWDCERRNFVYQVYHKDIMDQKNRSSGERRDTSGERRVQRGERRVHPPPAHVLPAHSRPAPKVSGKKTPIRRGKDRKSGSKRHRKVTPGNRNIP